MRKLLDFIVAYKHWFVFVLLLSLSLLQVMSDGVYRATTGRLALSFSVGRVQEYMTQLRSYSSLREKNIYLLNQYAGLLKEYQELQRQVQDSVAVGTQPVQTVEDSIHAATPQKHFLVARIVNTATRMGEPYLIINRGKSNGLQVDMAVVSAYGVVGSVMQVSDHYALVVPIVNSKLKLSCRLKGNDYRGTLTAVGMGSEARLSGLPLHTEVKKGDTLLTSGFSYIFPENIPVGTIIGADSTKGKGASGAFGNYRVKLMTDFDKLSFVYVLLDPPIHEAKELEEQSLPADE